jgi:hypothetical protein
MIYVNEWLPNPAGSDADGEWVELLNTGPGAVDLSGWRLMTDTGKGYVLNGVRLTEGEYAVLHRKTTRLTLRNTDGTVVLVDAAGAEVFRAAFRGTAPEGKSANRDEFNQAFFAPPTPDVANARPSLALVGEYASPIGQLGRGVLAGSEAALVGAMCGAAFICAALFIIKRNNGLRELFLGAH